MAVGVAALSAALLAACSNNNPSYQPQLSPGDWTDDREHELCAIWREVLNIPKIGIDDDFFELGRDVPAGPGGSSLISHVCDAS